MPVREPFILLQYLVATFFSGILVILYFEEEAT